LKKYRQAAADLSSEGINWPRREKKAATTKGTKAHQGLLMRAVFSIIDKKVTVF
jgi:hypothetical protein